MASKEEQLLIRRFTDLSRIADMKGRPAFSGFLNLNELNILHTIPKDSLYTQYCTFGGYDLAERQMAAFLPDALSLRPEIGSAEYAGWIRQLFKDQISAVYLEPISRKYADKLTHRDFLGSIMGLGIERSTVGDIALLDDCSGYVFAESRMKDYLIENLGSVRHTQMLSSEVILDEFTYEPRYEEIKGTVASVRLDALLALVYNTSRSKLTGYIEGGKVFVNGRLITTNAYQVKENDVISVRGEGKFRFVSNLAVTKKNRCMVLVQKYI